MVPISKEMHIVCNLHRYPRCPSIDAQDVEEIHELFSLFLSSFQDFNHPTGETYSILLTCIMSVSLAAFIHTHDSAAIDESLAAMASAFSLCLTQLLLFSSQKRRCAAFSELWPARLSATPLSTWSESRPWPNSLPRSCTSHCALMSWKYDSSLFLLLYPSYVYFRFWLVDSAFFSSCDTNWSSEPLCNLLMPQVWIDF